ncbi:hypothetical protein [Actinocrispum wychmicini]|uniref:Uncharacterized protein n=1 Tax=Actinocrispum wychmicini TaxID=1213861 RepID=A0A4R2IS66_9PSEU|nr:hypothetical protein [Actinocrispum wychmicini]TCO48114.1 hypothetical protein EV192_116167 [Actinocrispum wychmicini]
MRRRWGTLGVVLLLCAGCTGETSGDPPRVSVPRPTTGAALDQSIVDLKAAGAVHYNGSLTAPAGDKVTMDITATKAGESSGSLTVNGLPASVLVVDHTLYLKAGLDFWLKLSGVPDSTAPTVADHWVRAPGVLLGVDVERIFDTETLPTLFGKPTDGDRAPDTAPKAQIAGTDVIDVPTDLGEIYLAAKPPHGIVRFDLTKAGQTDPTRVHDLAFTITDATTDMAAIYTDLAARSTELADGYDPFLTVKQGAYHFEDCGASSCAIVVDLSNGGQLPARVAIRATWTGEGATIGSCDSRTGPLAPGQQGTARCTLASAEWAKFYRRAQSVAGQHPYGAEWTAMALTEPPDPAKLRGLAVSAATPVATPHGDEHVYVVHGKAGTNDPQIWKYAVASGPSWRQTAEGQLTYCLTDTRYECAVDEVAATGDPAAAQALARQLIDAYRGRTGTCPPGQWVGCAHP